MNGLHINGKILKKLSGPVYFSYLKPPVHRPDLPLLVLLGDAHGRNNLCEDCDNDSDECVKVFDKKFLLYLDQLADNYPLDFFTESSKEKELTADKNQILFHHFENVVRECFDVSKRSSEEYLKKCPTKRIRWNYGDPRHMQSTIEGHMTDLYTYLITIFEHRKMINKMDDPTLRTKYSFPTLSNTIMLLSHPSDKKEFVIEYIKDMFNIWFEEGTENTIYNKTKNMIDYTFEQMIKENSVIIKQLEKISRSENIDLTIEMWKEYMLDSLMNNETYKEHLGVICEWISNFSGMMKLFKDVYKNGLTYDEKQWYLKTSSLTDEEQFLLDNIDLIDDELTDHFIVIVLELHSFFLDMYVLSRAFKIPKGNDRSVLTIGYFGKQHCKQIEGLLTNYLNYSIETKIEDEHNCIVFDKPILLEQDVSEISEKRYSAYPIRLQQYKDVIDQEKTRQ